MHVTRKNWSYRRLFVTIVFTPVLPIYAPFRMTTSTSRSLLAFFSQCSYRNFFLLLKRNHYASLSDNLFPEFDKVLEAKDNWDILCCVMLLVLWWQYTPAPLVHWEKLTAMAYFERSMFTTDTDLRMFFCTILWNDFEDQCITKLVFCKFFWHSVTETSCK